jgi:hypothetical protein
MKLLCVKCDEQMTFKDAEGDADGSAGLVFVCKKCGNSFAMLINQMEAQLVKSLGVQVGGRKEPAQPMEVLKDSLMTGEEKKPGVITWEAEAEARLKNVPVFVRPMVRKRIENMAAEKGLSSVTTSVMDEAKKNSGM